MKTSVKFLLAAALVLLASLTAYNMALRAEYLSGAYLDPLRGYAKLDFKNFEEVAIPAASVLNVKVMAGPFGVRVNPDAREFVRVRQQGGRLIVEAALPTENQGLGGGDAVVISCPQLTALTTGGEHQLNGQPHRDKLPRWGPNTLVLVQGFTQDSLLVRQDLAGRVELTGNRLGLLRAVVGPTPGSHAGLTLTENNHIAAANLTIGHQSELTIDNVDIPKLRYQYGDSAKVTLTGRALRGGLR
ncbi:hypothetical protein [Hymenobacter psoromatis]|uniref:hypothetical protein n=1 Tax=Hymenobacter psoromatis TaxID=1484116 RepID=UPI001CBE6F49|nr:hypothetical protein [Hymenobacter psoromatis]